MKILFINDSFNPFGGAETSLFGDIKIAKENNHQVAVFSFGEKEIKKSNKFIMAESRLSFFRYLCRFFNLNAFLKLKRFIQETSPDLIHLNRNHKYPSAILLACRKQKIVQTTHDYGMICPTNFCVTPNGKICSGNPGLKCLTNKCLTFGQFLYLLPTFKIKELLTKKLVQAFISPSIELKKTLELNNFKNVSYIAYYLDLEKFSPQKIKIRKKRKGIKNILFVGRLASAKGVNFLIKAMLFILKQIPNARLQIIGDGPDKESLERLSGELNLEKRIEFLGRITYQKIPKYYRAADVFMIPSVWKEQFGFTGIEALACGTPCIASNIGGIPEWLIDGKTGFLVEPRNAQQVAERTIKILKNPKLAKKLGKEGRKLVKKEFNKKIHAQKLEKLYQATSCA